MAEEAFGPVFEIHGGGLDLVFPHHENELAQSNALGHEFARIWTHNGLLEFGGEKMSKSLGNDVSLRNVLDTWGREVVLLFFMTGHWRKPIDFTDETLQQAKSQWESFSNALLHEGAAQVSEQEWARLTAALDDDFNTPDALALMHEWRRRGLHAELGAALSLFGLTTEAREAPAELVALAEQRQEARAATDFAESDRLRDEIAAAGWDVRDEAGGFRLVPRS
jgi:cysteinyl-tRNA synthetase